VKKLVLAITVLFLCSLSFASEHQTRFMLHNNLINHFASARKHSGWD